MAMVIQPWQVLVSAFAGWISRHQGAVIEYLQEENRVLKQQLGRRRLRLTDDQRRRLAVRGKAIGRRALTEVASLVTPDTILRWHRQLIAEKWTHKRRRQGRPGIMRAIAELTVRMARENPRWGYTRIQGALHNVGHRVGRTTIANVLKENGIDPAPERGKRTTWSQFLEAHWNVLAAADFFTVEVWAPRGLITFYVFFVIELATRRIEIVGITPAPNEGSSSCGVEPLTGHSPPPIAGRPRIWTARPRTLPVAAAGAGAGIRTRTILPKRSVQPASRRPRTSIRCSALSRGDGYRGGGSSSCGTSGRRKRGSIDSTPSIPLGTPR
jgi:hypothetical protein